MPCLAVQHHHAHSWPCLAEHGEYGPALGIAWDGTGYGDDGMIWGGEFLKVDRRVTAGSDRSGRFRWWAAIAPPASRGVRPRVSASQPGETIAGELGFTAAEYALLLSAARVAAGSDGHNGAGRLFDAWATLLGISHHSAYEAEAAMRLEDAVDPDEPGALTVVMRADPDRLEEVDPLAARCWRVDRRPGSRRPGPRWSAAPTRGVLAARFHNGLAQVCLEIAWRVGLETVVLGGGCFQNAAPRGTRRALLIPPWVSAS